MYDPSLFLVYLRISAYILVSFASVVFLVSDDTDRLYKKAKVFLISKLMITNILLVSAVITLFGVNANKVRDFWITPTTVVWTLATLYLNFKKETAQNGRIKVDEQHKPEPQNNSRIPGL